MATTTSKNGLSDVFQSITVFNKVLNLRKRDLKKTAAKYKTR